MSMPLTPEVDALVEWMRGTGFSIADLGVSQARSLYVETLAQSGGPPVAMASIDDHGADLESRTLGLRRYRPPGLPYGAAATTVYYHGGGWVLGGLDSHDRICRQLAARARCQVIAVDYRLAPEHPLPAASLDAIECFAQLQDRAKDYDIEPRRMAVAGDSAGGQLAAVTALAARDQGRPLSYQALIYPATDLRGAARRYPSQQRNAHYPPLTVELMDWFSEHASDADSDARDWRVSPLLAASVENVAPAQVLTVGADMLMDEGVLYAARLRDAGVDCDHAHFPGVIHGAIEMSAWLDVTDAMLDRVASGLAGALSTGA